jgi:putative addiction module killer protein
MAGPFYHPLPIERNSTFGLVECPVPLSLWKVSFINYNRLWMFVESKQIELYVTREGKIPYEQWVNSLRDPLTVNRIDIRIGKLRRGLLGQIRSVGRGVSELKLDFGPGYRIYLGQEGNTIIVLLCGGDKSTQSHDIELAKEY